MSLAPCPSCARHVRRRESACPFCGVALALEPAPIARMVPAPRLGRAALFTFGAALATTTSACVGSAVPLYGAPIDAAPPNDAALNDAAASDAGSDAGQPMTLYGGPFFDDAGADTGGSSADYGAPPAP